MLKTTVEQLNKDWDRLPEWALGHESKESKAMAQDDEFEVVSSGWDEVDRTLGLVGEPKHIRKAFRDEKPKDRVLYRVFVPGMGIKQWEVAGATHAEIKEERKGCKEPFGDALIAVKRSGSGPDTRYRIRYRRQLNAQEIAARSDAGASKGIEAGDPF
jgi:hypothetical protein